MFEKMEKGDIIGKGRTAEVIYWGNNRVLKLFYKNFPSNIIDYQFKVDTSIGKIFHNCPKAFEKFEENSRIGIVYEYIDGIILTEFMGKKIKKVGKALRMLAEIHVDMHKNEINEINSQKNTFKLAINKTDLLDDDQKIKIIKYMEKLPDGNTVCHGDLHPENILVSNNKMHVIDWSNSYSGNPNGDVARTYYTIKHGLAPSDEYMLKKSFIHRFFFKAIKSLLAKTYIKHYLKLTGISLKEIKQWDLVIYAARLSDPVPLEYDNLLKMINKKIKHN
jgi:thiamine kinase-like enzyme